MSERWPGSLISPTAPIPSGGGAGDSAPGVWTLDQAAPYIATQTWPGTGTPDPQFQYVTALLHGDGTNGGQNNTFLDSSSNNFTITRNGNTTQGSFSPYGNLWSNSFGTSNYFTVANNSAILFGSSNWTVEFWINPASLSGNLFLFCLGYGYSNNYRSLIIYCGSGEFRMAQSPNGSTNYDVSLGLPTPPLNQWAHIAVVRNGSTVTPYFNGVAGTPQTAQDLYATPQPLFINNQDGQSSWLNGYLSNYRVVKGTAVYTSNFTPPTAPLTAISGTSLLLCNSNRFVDTSGNNLSFTVSGTPSVQRFSPFQSLATYQTATIGGSGYFDGSSYLNTPTSGQFNPSGDFTIGCWAYLTSLPSYTGLIANYTTNTSTDWLFEIQSNGAVNFYTNGSVIRIQSSSGVFIANQWNYVSMSRSGSTITGYVNGVSVGTYSQSGAFGSSSKTIAIGAEPGGLEHATGYISDVKLIDGTAITTVPTAPLTATTGTNLLLNFTNGAIYDNAEMNDLQTVGSAQISTSVAKYGTGSMSFDGSSSVVSPYEQSLTIGTGNFTIECWAYCTNSSTYNGVFQMSSTAGGLNAGTSNTLAIDFKPSNAGFEFYANGSSNQVSFTTVNNTWYHLAISRVGTTTLFFVNGNLVSTITGDSTNYTTPYICIGGIYNGSYYFHGNIDDLRITNGYARYWFNFQPPAAAFPNYGGTLQLTYDPYFSNTTLLLNGDGTNGAQNNTFLDSSTNNFTITRNGNTTQGSFSPYGNLWSNYFNGSSGNYLVTPNSSGWDFGSGDFTIECWVNMAQYINGGGESYTDDWIVSLWDGSTGYWSLRVGSGVSSGNALRFTWNNFASNVFASTDLPLNSWVHLVVACNGSTISLFQNGTRVATTSISGITSSSGGAPVYIGNINNYNRPFNGYISNLRIVKGTDVYGATNTTLTVPTAPLTAISGTSLLTCQSNRFIDNSSNAYALTASGSPSVQRFSPFNPTAPYSTATIGGSGYQTRASSSYLSSNMNAMGTGDFTVSMWIYPTSGTSNTSIFDSRVGGATGFGLYTYVSGTSAFYYSTNSALQASAGSLAFNAWSHVEVCRSSGTVYCFVNGVLGTSFSDTRNLTSTLVNFASSDNGGNNFDGYMSNVQILNTALHTTNFTPPTAPYTAGSNTQYLISYTNAGIPDLAMQNDLQTVGNAQVSTAQKKFGTGSLYFDGSGSYLPMASNQEFAFGTGDFTIEFWMYSNDNAGNTQRGPFQISTTAGGISTSYSGGIVMFQGSTTGGAQLTGAIMVGINGFNFIGSNAPVISLNTWYHIAVVRQSGTVYLYVNGVSVGSGTNTANLTATNLVVGGYYSSSYLFNGYLDDFRITSGYCRYPNGTAFTPPTAALPTY